MELIEFLNRIHMVQPAVEMLKQLAASKRIKEEQYLQDKMLYKRNRQQFYEKVKQHKDYRLRFLYDFCRMGVEAYEDYQSQGIGDEIFDATFYDLTLWCENCFREYGEYGINEYDWFFRHFDLQIFRLGRLEFEKMESPWEIHAAGWEIRKGHPVISVHIPQREKLTPQAVAHSLEKGKSFWGDELPYLCHSWLLYPGLKEVLSQTSNILQFQNYFQIVDIDFAENEAEWRIFGKVEENPEKYPENTTLQKRAKQYLLSGKKLGNGLGVLQEL